LTPLRRSPRSFIKARPSPATWPGSRKATGCRPWRAWTRPLNRGMTYDWTVLRRSPRPWRL